MSLLSQFGTCECWIMLGILCVLVELLLLPAFGMLILGSGAITTGCILLAYPAEQYQYLLFIISAVLWCPIILKYRKKTARNNHGSDLIGQEVIVVNTPLTQGTQGTVQWSGTAFNAILSEEVSVTTPVGTTLVVQEVRGNVVVCKLKA